MSAKKARVKESENSITTSVRGPEVYKYIEWHTLNDDEAKSHEKEESFAWRVLTNTQMQALMPLPIEDLQMRLAELMNLPGHETMLDEAVLLDCYTSAFWWGKEQGWNEQQISGLITVHHQLLDNLRSHNFTLEDNLGALRKMMVGIGTKEDRNGGLDFLDISMASMLVEFVSSTFFQHYRLYEFLFSSEREEEVISTDLEVELIPPASLPHPPPLDEGLPEAMYLRHLAPPPPESPAVEVSSVHTTDDVGEEAATLEGDRQADSGEIDIASDLLDGITSEDVQTVFDSVSKELFSSLQSNVAAELKERESEILRRINKIHCVLDTS